MAGAAWFSHRFTAPVIRQQNDFSFEPLKEVAWLFLGIFTTLVPVIHSLTAHSKSFLHPTDLQLYLLTGSLSAVLDNAPTYLTFLTLALTLHEPQLHLLNPADVALFANQCPKNAGRDLPWGSFLWRSHLHWKWPQSSREIHCRLVKN